MDKNKLIKLIFIIFYNNIIFFLIFDIFDFIHMKINPMNMGWFKIKIRWLNIKFFFLEKN